MSLYRHQNTNNNSMTKRLHALLWPLKMNLLLKSQCFFAYIFFFFFFYLLVKVENCEISRLI